jgi:hypothetical protein
MDSVNRKTTPKSAKRPLAFLQKSRLASVDPHELGKMRVHAFANAFSMESLANTKLLAEDLKANGQRHPVIVSGNVVIDGRNRIKAAQMAGVNVWVKYLPKMSEKKIRSLILSLNVKRTERPVSERARLALEHYDEIKASGGVITLQSAANEFNVSKRTLDRLIEKRNAKDTPRKLVRRITVGDVAKRHHVMIEALSKMYLFKEYGKGYLCQYKKYSSRIICLARDILSQGEMRGEVRTHEALMNEINRDEDP